MSELMTAEGLLSFATLTFLEIILGIDNIVFLAVAVERLRRDQQRLGRQIGLWLAMGLRILMLIGLVWLTKLDISLFSLFGKSFSIKDLVLIGGGLFLLAKGTLEIHTAIEEEPHGGQGGRGGPSFISVMVQVAVINIIFSLDSVITAVGMTNILAVMIAAVVASTLVMLLAAKPVGDFIHHRPTTKMLALSFILLIGMALVADGVGFHLPRGYLYFAIAFSLFVEVLNITYFRRRTKKRPRRESLGE